jgi:LPS-assembly protein
MFRNFLAGLLAAGLLAAGSPALGADLLKQPWTVEADKISRGATEQEVIAEGNVVLERTGTPTRPMTIEADWVRHDAKAGVVEARGNVRLRSKKENADAAEATIVLGDETARLVDSKVFFPDTNIHFASKEARKDAEMVYYFRDGVFTTCDFDAEHSPVWSLSMREADIDVDGFIFMKHSVLRVKNVPVLYLPFMAFPGRMERQTGFLNPELSSSDRGGSGIMTPFFIDLSPSADITLYPGYFANRGAMLGGEFRAIHDFGSRLSLQASFIDDRLQDEVDDDYQDDGYLRTRSNRYWVRGKGDYDFGGNFKLLADVDFASDRDFLMEFNDGPTGFDESHQDLYRDLNRGLQEYSLPWRSSSLQLVKHGDHAFVGAETSYVDDLNPSTTPDTTVIHTLPKVVSIGALAIPATRLNLNWDAEYINYWRDEGLGLQRVDLHPRLTAPIPLGPWLEASVTGGLRQTYYQVEPHGDAQYDSDTPDDRLAWDGALSVATTFQRDFAVQAGSWRGVTHTVKPHTSYGYLDPDDDEELLPDFDARDSSVAQSVVGYGLDNHFRISGVKGDGKSYGRYFGALKINHSYDHRKDIEPYGDLKVDLDIYPLERLRIKYSTDISVYGRGAVKYDLLGRYTNERGDFLALDYRYGKDSDIHTINGSAEVRLLESLSLRGEIKKSLAVDNVVSQSVSLLYQPGCWGMQVKFSESGDDKRVSVLFSLVALGQAFGIGYEENFGGDFEFATSTDPLDHENF